MKAGSKVLKVYSFEMGFFMLLMMQISISFGIQVVKQVYLKTRILYLVIYILYIYLCIQLYITELILETQIVSVLYLTCNSVLWHV